MPEKKLKIWESRKWIGIISLIIFAVLILVLVKVISSRADDDIVMLGDVSFDFVDGYCEIKDEDQLLALRKIDIEEGSKFKLMNDITVTQTVDDAATNSFQGELYGNNKKITFDEIDIVTKSNSEEEEVYEGILFGTVTGTIEKLFVNVNSVKYEFDDTYQVDMDQDIEMTYIPKDDEFIDVDDKEAIIQLAAFTKTEDGTGYDPYTGTPSMDEDNPDKELDFYFLQEVDEGTATKGEIDKMKEKKSVYFGLVGAVINQGSINNLQIEGEITASTKQNEYLVLYNDEGVEAKNIVRYYKVVYYGIRCTKEVIIPETYVYTHAFDGEKFDDDIPLYNGAKPLYKRYEEEDGSWWFHIPKEGGIEKYPVYAEEGKDEAYTKKIEKQKKFAFQFAKYNNVFGDTLYDEDGNPNFLQMVDKNGEYWFIDNQKKYPVYDDGAGAELIIEGYKTSIEETKGELEGELVTTKEKMLSSADLYAGAIAGKVQESELNNIDQNVSLIGNFVQKEDAVVDEDQMSYIFIGGLTGLMDKGAKIEDCYITGDVSLVDNIPEILEAYGADITGIIKENVQAKSFIINNGSDGKIFGKKEGTLDIVNGYTTEDTDSPDTDLEIIDPEIFSDKNLTNWKCIPEEITESEDVYTLNWLYRNGGFKEMPPSESSSIVDLILSLDESGKAEIKGKLNYKYRPDINEGEKPNTKDISDSSISLTDTDLGNSAYLLLDYIYYEDDRFYYYNKYEENQYIYPYMNLPNDEGEMFETIYEKFLYRDENFEDFIQVSGNMLAGNDSKFYYISNSDLIPVKENTSSNGEYEKADMEEGIYEDNKWNVNISFTGTPTYLTGFWTQNDKIYPIKTSDEYTEDDQERLEPAENFEISRYYEDNENAKPYYTKLLDLELPDRHHVYPKQKIKVLDYDEAVKENQGFTYYWLFSKKELDVSNSEEIRLEGKEYVYDASGEPTLIVPDGEYKEGDNFYLYILTYKQGLPGGLKKLGFTMTSESEIVAKPASSIIISGSNIMLDMGELDGKNGFEGIRFVDSDKQLNLKNLSADYNMKEEKYEPGKQIIVPMYRNGSELRRYLHVQYYGSYEGKKIVGDVEVFEYTFAEQTGLPSISPNTIMYFNSTAGAYVCNSNTKVELSATNNSTIIYSTSESEEYKLKYPRVTDENILSQLPEITENTQKTTVLKNKMYLHCNSFWYELSDGAKVYDPEKGIILNNTSSESKFLHIYAVAFAEDYEPSEVVQYVYEVEPPAETSAPTAILPTSAENPTLVPLQSYLYFQSTTPDAEIYYTLDGTVPDTKEGGSTKKYDIQKGILVEGEHKELFRVNMLAVKWNKEGEFDLKPSKSVSFLYRIEEKDTVDAPTSIPATTDENPTVLSPGKKIILSTSTKGAEIYYTIDGTEPKVNNSGKVKNGMKYDSSVGIIMPEDGTDFFTIRAIAVKSGMNSSSIVQLTFSYPERVLPPYASPSSGVVDSGTTVTLTNATEGAAIYYEIAYDKEKPKNPTAASAVFDSKQSFTITKKTTIKAIAVKDGVMSKVATFSYSTSKLSDAPTASIESGSVVSKSTLLTITSESGSAIYYTTDGSDPNESSNKNVIAGETLMLDGEYGSVIMVKACAKTSDKAFSNVSTFTYQISRYQGGVTSSIESGSDISSGATVNLTTDITNASIYYTVDGHNPSSGDASGTAVTLHGEPGTIVTLKAMAIPIGVNVNEAGSAEAIFNYKIKDTITAPEASPAGGTLTSQTSVTLTAAKGDIYYTTDGSAPTINSTPYSEPINVNKSMEIKAIAATSEGEVSTVSVFTYSTAMRAAKPVSSIADGVLEPGSVIKLSSQTSGSTIYYSTDGTTPNMSNLDSLLTFDGEGITINRTVSIQAVAYKDGYLLSNPATYHYEVKTPLMEREKKAAEAKDNEIKETDASSLRNDGNNGISGPSFTDIVLKESKFSTIVSCEEGTIPKSSRLIAKQEECKENVINNIQVMLGEEYEMLSLYDMSIYEESTSIQPGGKIEIGMPIPEEYENAALQIVYVDKKGNIKKYDTRRSNGMAYAITDHFSLYGLVGVKNEVKNNFTVDVVYFVAGTAVIVAATGIIFFYFQKKRKKLPKRVRKNL